MRAALNPGYVCPGWEREAESIPRMYPPRPLVSVHRADPLWARWDANAEPEPILVAQVTLIARRVAAPAVYVGAPFHWEWDAWVRGNGTVAFTSPPEDMRQVYEHPDPRLGP